jgi:hypothetical protein
MPIKVVSGAINYIGEYSATKDFLWEVSSNETRDIPLFKNKYPELNWDSLIIVLPKTSNEVSVQIKQ